MNIEQYRALKAQEEAQQAQPEVVEQPVVEEAVVPEVEPKVIEETKPEEPEVIEVEIDGAKVSLDELKNGYLRQSDYTKKTQELAHQRKETAEAIELFNTLKQNPQAVQAIQQNVRVPKALDPSQAKVMELETKMYDMMLEREIETLQSKYEDFEVREVLAMADKKQLTDLEDAYHLVKSSKQASSPQIVDVDKLKEELRQELLKEINSNVETNSIISTGTAPMVQNPTTPTLSKSELKVAAAMGLNPQDYAKWRDIDKKK